MNDCSSADVINNNNFQTNPSVQDKCLVLDLDRLVVDTEGVKPFYWPVKRDEIIAFRNLLFESYFRYLRESEKSHQGNVDILTVLTLEFLREAMTLFYSRMVLRRAKNHGYKICSIPEYFNLMIGLEEKLLHQQSRTWHILNRGVPKKQWAIPLRYLRNCILRDEFRRKSLSRLNVQDDIISAAFSPLIRRHAGSISEHVYLVPARGWFYPLNEIERNDMQNFTLDNAFLQGIIGIIGDCFRKIGEPFEHVEEEYLRNWLSGTSCLVHAYMQRLYNKPEIVPRRLWTGTGGIIWMRILRLVCKRLDGNVTGHEHGTASGQSPSINLGLWEFEHCDRFITFTRNLAQQYKDDRHYHCNVTQNRPEIISITDIASQGNKKSSNASLPKQSISCSSVKTIMYINTIYQGERAAFTPGFSDIAWVDWQARVIGSLQGHGYEVFLKPHPEGKIRPPKRLESLADKVLQGYLSKVINKTDAFLFDWIQTTTFVQALDTCKPIVIVDFGFTSMDSESMKKLKKRCVIIEGYEGKDGRAHVDFRKLNRAFIEACELVNNQEYYLNYQGDKEG